MIDINNFSPKRISSPTIGENLKVDPAPFNIISDGSGRGASSPRDANLPTIDSSDPNSIGNRIDNPQDPKGPTPSPTDPSYPDNIINAALGVIDIPGSVSDNPDSLTSTPVNTITTPETYFPLWQPDSNLSPEENLAGLTSWLSALFQFYSMSGGYDYQYQTLNYANILQYAYAALSDMGPLRDLSDSATVALAEKIADVSFKFINAAFESALSYQSWYLQQEYNSPINQVNRLVDAGLSTSFAIGSYNSGNASSPAAVPRIDQPSLSGASQAQAQADSNKLGFISTLIQAGASLLPGAAGAVASLVTSFATKKLTAKQIQLAGSEIVNNAATYEILRQNLIDAKSNTAYRDFDKLQAANNLAMDSSFKNVDSSKAAYDLALQYGTQEIEEQAYQVLVKDKSGNFVNRTITVDEVEDALRNRGQLSDQSVIAGSESWKTSAAGHISTKVDLPLVGSASAGGDLSHTDAGNKSKSDSKSSLTEKENLQKLKQSYQGYSEDGTSFRIGDTKFTSVIKRKRVTLPEHREYIDKCLHRYEKALDEYNTLSTGDRARLLDLLDNIQLNIKQFSSGVVNSAFLRSLLDKFYPQPDNLVGD